MAKKLLPLINAPRLALSGIKIFRGMEGPGLNATLYFDGRSVADVLNQGNGGCLCIRYAAHATESAVADYIESLRLPEEMLSLGEAIHMYACDLETLIDRTVDAHETAKLLARYAKTKVLFRLPSDADGTWRTLTHNGQVEKTQAWVRAKYPQAVLYTA